MLSRNKNILIALVIGLSFSPVSLFAVDAGIATIDIADLPINVSEQAKQASDDTSAAEVNVAPSNTEMQVNESSEPVTVSEEIKPAQIPVTETIESQEATNIADDTKKEDTTIPTEPASLVTENSTLPVPTQEDFSFDLKMKEITPPATVSTDAQEVSKTEDTTKKYSISDDDIPQVVQYTADPIENLGNSILSQMDGDLFKQMSDIEKSTTLLTLELRREKIRNEIEAQKAIRQKGIDELERQKAEEKLKEFEKKKQLEAQVVREQQALVDKKQLLEVFKQRKLLNAYMNHMLKEHQSWLLEKEGLYAQLASVENEKRELIAMFKQRIDTLLEVSAKNIQAAEAAKANFERIVKGLKARNEQLKKRIAADAQIIKDAQKNLSLKSQSIEELKDKNIASAIAAANLAGNGNTTQSVVIADSEIDDEDEPQSALSSQYALLGISGHADTMLIDLIDSDGVPSSLTKGATLPTGHIVTEIGPDFVKFNKDGYDEYLYIGRSIDGIIPTLGLSKETK